MIAKKVGVKRSSAAWSDALVEQQRDDRDRDDVRPQQPAQCPMAGLPFGFGQRPAVRQDAAEVPGRVPECRARLEPLNASTD